MSLLDKAREEPKPVEKDAWYRCTAAGCDFKTKQRKGLLEVLHHCAKTKTLKPCKEDKS